MQEATGAAIISAHKYRDKPEQDRPKAITRIMHYNYNDIFNSTLIGLQFLAQTQVDVDITTE